VRSRGTNNRFRRALWALARRLRRRSFVPHSISRFLQLPSQSIVQPQHVTHPHSHLSNRFFLCSSLMHLVFSPHSSPLFFDLHWPACRQSPSSVMHVPLPLRTRRPLPFRYLGENKFEHLSKSPLGVRVMMYRNVSYCLI